MRSFEYTIKEELGMHARPAGLLVKVAKALDSDVQIVKDGKSVGAARLMALMGMGIKCGDIVTVTISGGDEESSEKAMKEFFEANL